MTYTDEMTIQEALDKYFVISGFGKANYGDKWVRIDVGPFPFIFPNTDGRRRLVKFHDIHHILTEFPTTLEGESQIAAWELGSGCKKYVIAWVLNLLALFLGLFIDAGKVFTAFVRGRRAKNLFGESYDSELLNSKVGTQRENLRVSKLRSPVTSADRFSFFLFVVLAQITTVIVTIILLSPMLVIVFAMT